jgi:serine/threonine protein kinase
MRKSGGQRSSMPSSDDQLIYKADIWSAGIVLFVMITGEFPFPNKNNLLLLFEDIAKGNYVIPSWIQDSMLKDLLKKLLTVDPAKRISIDEIFEHPWLDKDLPRQTPVPIDPAPSSFGHDSKTVEATVKKLRKQLELEAKERAEMNGGLEEDEDDSDDGASFSRGRMVMTRSIDDLRNRSRATSRNPSKTPPRSRASDSDSEQGNFADEFSRSSSLSASDSSSGKDPSRDRVGKRKSRGEITAGSTSPSPRITKKPSQRRDRQHDRNGSSSPKKGSKQSHSSPDASPSSTSHSNTTNTENSSEATSNNNGAEGSPGPSMRELGRSRSQNRKCSIM